MKWIGLTGGIGSGKSTVADLLRQEGIPVIDADEQAKLVLNPGTEGYNQVLQQFGLSVLDANKNVNRKTLSNIVFNNPQKLKILEGITHPLIQSQVQLLKENYKKQGAELLFYDVPLLFEKNLQDQFDAVVLVYCPESTQIERVMKRNNLSKQDVLARMTHQIPLIEKKQKADFVINNEGSLKDLKNKVHELILKLKQL